jgi:hypothetical protein
VGGLIDVPDTRAQQAREHQRLAAEADELATRHRQQRDQLVRALRAADPSRWTYRTLADAVGCTRELINAIVHGRTGPAAVRPDRTRHADPAPRGGGHHRGRQNPPS